MESSAWLKLHHRTYYDRQGRGEGGPQIGNTWERPGIAYIYIPIHVWQIQELYEQELHLFSLNDPKSQDRVR